MDSPPGGGPPGSGPLDVAVVGMAGAFPGAPDLDAFWRNVETGRSAITELDRDRIDPVFVDPESNAVDRIYCRRGGFLPEPLEIDAAGFGVMPTAAAGADPDQILMLRVAEQCLHDAGHDRGRFDPHRAGIIVGRGGYLTPGLARLDQKVRGAEQLVEALRTLVPGLGPDRLAAIKEQFQSRAGVFGPDTAIGLVPNLTASRVANRLDLRGPAYTIDAACASSLVAVDLACREIRSGRCEVMLAGGVHVTHDPTLWAVFSQLGALSRSGSIRPFDRRADGLLVGEGCGLLLLKSVQAAERDGDRIYCRILGVGVSSDGRSSSLFAPRIEGQVGALHMAWREAGLEPSRVGLLEAHGTATPAGDAAEIATLAEVFGPAEGDGPRPVVGSVKSMIGHAMPAAGAAGLIKAVLACHHGVLPATLHCEEPNPALRNTRFRVVGRSEPWDEERRVAAVNAFGFGGINAHVVLETAARARRRKPVPVTERSDLPVLALAADSPDSLLKMLDLQIPRGGSGPCRLAVIDPSPDRLAKARRLIEKGDPFKGKMGIWFTPSALGESGGKVLFMYPGVEAVFQPHVEDLAGKLSLEPPTHTRPNNLEETGKGVVWLGLFLHQALEQLGVRPDAMAGHSIGEWTGMMASGVMEKADVVELLDSLRPGSLEVPGVLFAAAGCGLEAAERAMAGLSEIAISHDNCPHQVILCGQEESIETARQRLIEAGVICQVLPFKSGFHSPLFQPYLEPHRGHFGRLPLRAAETPLYSATTADLYPEDPERIRALALDHLVRPLRYRELIERWYADGYRVFVQVGIGSLVGFVEDTLKGRPHLAVTAGQSGKSGLAVLRNLALALFAEGVSVDLDRIVPPVLAASSVRLDLSARLIRLDRDLAVTTGPALEGPPSGSPIAAALTANLEALAGAQSDVAHALADATRAASRSERLRLSVDTYPALWDHSFFPQPAGWECVSDCYPVVPMTMTVELILEAARRLCPGREPVALESLQAVRWLLVEPEVDVTIKARRLSSSEVEVEVEGYASGRVRLANHHSPAPPPDHRPLQNPRPADIDAVDLYRDRYMFHGPRYQGVVAIESVADDGIRGELEVTDAPGALLDNAGQLFGYWVMATQPRDRLAMPLGFERLELFGPHPALGDRLTCAVRIVRCEELEVEADLELYRDDRVWARIKGWTDLRFASDDRMWSVMRHAETHVLSEDCGGYHLYDDASQRTPSRDWLMRRYLGEKERKLMLEAGPRRQRHFLNGRIAAKDAVRALLWAADARPIFPVELSTYNDDEGRPRVQGVGGLAERDLRLSIAHTGDLAVAVAAEGVDVGIDVELIESRPEGFDEHAFDASERRMLEQIAEGSDSRLDEWRTRLWCAKEAAAKARGTGLGGTPRRVVVQQRDGDRLRVDDRWVTTQRRGSHIVAWTETD